jgi:basic amino acid/polyamine antiporter, APA family
MSTADPQPTLIRAIGRWTLAVLVLNGILGSGIFALPSTVAKLLGGAALWGYAVAGAGVAVIVAVCAELASQFRDAGGPYLYARVALGRFAGIQVGWFLWLMRLTAAAAVADVFVLYLAEFWPAAATPLARAAVMTVIFGGLAAVNYRGVRAGALFSNLVTAAKLVPLAIFIVVGLVRTSGTASIAAAVPAGSPTAGDWTDALIALVFAYGGFEAALVPAAETKNPRRDMPLALFTALGTVALLYILIHRVAMRALPDLAHSVRPLADAARVFAGQGGAALIAVGALLATFGWLAAQLLTAPRITYALAERGDFPAVFARVHPRFRTPYVSIVIWAVVALVLAVSGNFLWNAILSVAARLVTYAAAGAALIQLRRRAPNADAWRAPAGNLLGLLAIAFCAALILRLTPAHAAIIAGVGMVAALNWLAVRRRGDRPAPAPAP